MLLVFGTICLDRVRHVPSMPAPGGYVGVLEEETRLGGEAANTTYALAQWAADVKLYGNSVDPAATALLHDCGLENLNAGPAADAPICDIYVTPDGERTMFGWGFDRMAETIDPAAVPYREGAWLTLDMNFGETGIEVARKGKKTGMRLYLMDLAPPESLAPILEPGDYWQSSTDWVGIPGDIEANTAWATKHAKKLGANVILTDAGRPYVLARSDGSFERHATIPPPGPPVDSTGAGDRFRAAMLFGLDQGWEQSRCLLFAGAAASLKVVHMGAICAIDSVATIEAHASIC